MNSAAALYINDTTGSMSFAWGNKWIIGDLTSATLSGNFLDATINGPTLGGGLSWHTEQVGSNWLLSITPEPSRALLLMLGMTGVLVRRRRAAK